MFRAIILDIQYREETELSVCSVSQSGSKLTDSRSTTKQRHDSSEVMFVHSKVALREFLRVETLVVGGCGSALCQSVRSHCTIKRKKHEIMKSVIRSSGCSLYFGYI